MRQKLSGYQTARKLRFAVLDTGWQARDLSEIHNVFAYEESLLQATELYTKVAGTNTSCSFSNIFQGGYYAYIVGRSTRCL